MNRRVFDDLRIGDRERVRVRAHHLVEAPARAEDLAHMLDHLRARSDEPLSGGFQLAAEVRHRAEPVRRRLRERLANDCFERDRDRRVLRTKARHLRRGREAKRVDVALPLEETAARERFPEHHAEREDVRSRRRRVRQQVLGRHVPELPATHRHRGPLRIQRCLRDAEVRDARRAVETDEDVLR